MATKPSAVPRWAETAGGTPASGIVEPASGDKDIGWEPDDRPPAEWFNWFMHNVYRWVLYLRDGVIVGQAGAPGLTVTGGTGAGGKGMVVTAGGTNENGIEVTSTGIGSALKATTGGGATGYAVEAVGLANTGVRATSTGSGAVDAACSGAGFTIHANSGAGTGYAIQATGNGTRAPLRLVPQAQPSSAQEGDIYMDSGDHKVRIHTGSAWVVIGTQT